MASSTKWQTGNYLAQLTVGIVVLACTALLLCLTLQTQWTFDGVSLLQLHDRLQGVTVALPSWAVKPEKVVEPVPTSACLSGILRRSTAFHTNLNYLPERDFGENPVVIVTQTPDHFDPLHVPRCDIPCYHVKDSGNMSEWAYRTDGYMDVLYLTKTTLPRTLKCAATQRNFEGTMESAINYPKRYLGMQNRDFQPLGDVGTDEEGPAITVLNNVLFRSEPPVAYFQWHKSFYDAEYVKFEDKQFDVVAVISNCRDKHPYSRLKYIEDMKKAAPELHIDLYGKCGPRKEKYLDAKEDLLRKYKFVLAFENSATKDYVTEKFFDALDAGAVPVVYGAPNIHDFEPGEKSIIVADDFESPAELAQHLLRLSRNRREYMLHHTWRRTGGSDKFKAMMDTQAVSHFCRVCIAMADKWVQRQEPSPWLFTEHILVRERNTFYFRVIPLIPHTVMQLHALIYDAFKNYTPVWGCSLDNSECSNMSLRGDIYMLFADHLRAYHDHFRIYSIYPAYSTQEDAQRNPYAWLTNDTTVSRLKSGDKLEVIFV